MLKAIIIDDELIGINTLKLLIERHTEGLKIIATCTEPEKGIELIEDYKPDVVFLDISMPSMDGFEVIKRLTNTNFHLVFTTAHSNYAIQAIKTKAQDYLLKPINIEELQKCVAVIIKDIQKELPALKENTPLIELPVRNGVLFIKPKDIIRLEASGSYTTFYLDNHVKEVVSKNLKSCENLLIPQYFYRCHDSHLINLNKVIKLISNDGLFVEMSDGSLPQISRKNKEELLVLLRTLNS